MPARPSLTDRLSDPLADPALDRSRLRFAAMMIGIGLLHFAVPGQFTKIVPRWVPQPRAAVLWSGVAEVASGAMIAVPRTRRLGGWLATTTIVAVYPANIQMAMDATRSGSKIAMVGTWARLPMQFPMIVKAFSFTR